MRSGGFLLAFAFFSTSPLYAQGKLSDWRAFRGNDGTGISSDTGLPTTWSSKENVAWKTELPGAGTSTPIIVGKRIFVTCYSGYNVPGKQRGKQEDLKLHVVCLDRETGKITWAKDVEPKLPEQDTIRDGHGYASSTPVADDNGVYVFFGKSGVLAFDNEGKQLWRTNVGDKLNGWGSGASLLLSGDNVIVNASVESETLFALDCKTGKETWKAKGIKESWNTPILAKSGEKTELILAIGGKVLGFDPKSGEQSWSCATDIPWYMVPSIVANDGIVYALGGRPGGALAVKLGGTGDVTKTHRLWTSKKGSNVSSPVYHDGHLYWMHDNTGTVFCANVKTGEVVYEEKINRGQQAYGSAALADGKVFYPGRNGTTYVVAAKPKYELLASNSLDERGEYNASPAVAGGKLFLRTNTALYCIAKK